MDHGESGGQRMNQIQRKNPFWSLAGPMLAYLGIQWGVQTIIDFVVSMPYILRAYADVLNQGTMPTMQEWFQTCLEALEPAFDLIAAYQVEIAGVTALATFALTIPLFVKDRKLEKMLGVSIAPKMPAVGYGYIVLFGAAGCVAATCLAAMAQLAFYYDAQYQQTAEVLYTAGLPMQLLVLGVVVPVAEEMMFRGILFKRFRERQGFWYSAVCSSVFFAFMHTSTTQTIYALLLGLMLSYLYEKFRTIKAPVILHIVMNMGAVFLTETGGFQWIASDPVRMAAAAIGGAFLCSVAFVLLQRMLRSDGEQHSSGEKRDMF